MKKKREKRKFRIKLKLRKDSNKKLRMHRNMIMKVTLKKK